MTKQNDQPTDRSENQFDPADAANLLDKQQEQQRQDLLIDEAGEESFPASDPPSFSMGTATPKKSNNRASGFDSSP